MTCFVDCDGVLANFCLGVCKAFNRKDLYDNYPKGTWDLSKVLNVTTQQFWAGFNHEELFANLEKMPDADEIIGAVREYFSDEDICIFTAPSAEAGSVVGKLAWLAKHYPEFAVLIGDRKEFCAHGRAILIDDRPRNILNFDACGGHTILIPRPWNDAQEQADMRTFVSYAIRTILRGE